MTTEVPCAIMHGKSTAKEGTRLSSFALAALALAFLFLDSTGLALFPRQQWFRAAGFFAFPLFCFLLVQGFMQAKDRKKYALHLLLLALAAEIPFDLLLFGRPFELSEQNAAFSLVLSLLALTADESLKEHMPLRVLSWLASGLLALILNVSYGFLGPFLCLSFQNAATAKRQALSAFAVSLGYAIVLLCSGADPAFLRPALAAPLSCVPIFLYDGRPSKCGRALSFILYAAWPLVLLLLLLMRSTRIVPPWFLK